MSQEQEEYIQVGRIVAVHGVQGDLVLKHNLGHRSAFTGIQVFFLEGQAGKLLPYFMEKASAKNETESLLKLEGIDTREKAALLLRKNVWLPRNLVRKSAAADAPISLLGYQVVEKGRKLGEVLEVIEQPGQLILRIEMEAKEVFIPLNESTLVKINRRSGKIEVNLPEGLLDIYL